jgi:hypothetical protein
MYLRWRRSRLPLPSFCAWKEAPASPWMRTREKGNRLWRAEEKRKKKKNRNNRVIIIIIEKNFREGSDVLAVSMGKRGLENVATCLFLLKTKYIHAHYSFCNVILVMLSIHEICSYFCSISI